MRDNDPSKFYARDDGTYASVEQCTREELVIAVRQLLSQEATLRSLLSDRERDMRAVRDDAYQRASKAVLGLSEAA